jgi:hypothetical protein
MPSSSFSCISWDDMAWHQQVYSLYYSITNCIYLILVCMAFCQWIYIILTNLLLKDIYSCTASLTIVSHKVSHIQSFALEDHNKNWINRTDINLTLSGYYLFRECDRWHLKKWIAHCKEIVNEKNLKCFAIRDDKFKINE